MSIHFLNGHGRFMNRKTNGGAPPENVASEILAKGDSAERPQAADDTARREAETAGTASKAPFGARLRASAMASTDNTFLVYFRIAFGLLLVYTIHKSACHDTIWQYYIEPTWHFTYPGFGWLHPWPGNGMYIHFGAVAVAAACMAVGFYYRIASALFAFGFAYIFLLDQSYYLNHYYLVCLVGAIMPFLPANRALSYDAWRWPKLRSDGCPAWVLWLLRFEFGMPYFMGGIAKLNTDWLAGEPLRTWMADNADMPMIGPWLTEEWCVHAFVWGGLLLDLLAVPLLLWRRTRIPMLILTWMFHLMNSQLFDIGIFPWMMICATTLLYLPPSTIARMRFWRPKQEAIAQADGSRHTVPLEKLGFTVLVLFIAVQIVLPFRHYLYPGPVALTREGHCFSWRMKLNIRALEPNLRIEMEDGTSENIQLWQWMTRMQAKRLRNTSQLLQLARRVRESMESLTGQHVEVYSDATVSLNGHPPRLLVRPSVDLSRQPMSIAPARWLTTYPSDEPIRERDDS